jgi:RNA-dependent RNA polymerase
LLQRVAGFIPLGRHDDDLVAEIWELYCNYASQLQTLCADHTLSHERNAMLTEEEAVVGTIMAKCSQPRKRKDLMSKMREQATTLVDGVRFDISGEEGTLPGKSMERAWVAFRIASMEDETFGARSFAWIAMGEIFDAIRTIEESEGLYDL